MSTPAHYLTASTITRPALASLGFFLFEGECRLIIESHHSWMLTSAYVWQAAKYLWRCEQKGDLAGDLEKAENFLSWATMALPVSDERKADIDDCLTEVRRLRTAIK